MAISIGNMIFEDKEEFLDWCSEKFKTYSNVNYDKLWENLQLYSQLSSKTASSADIKISDDGKLILGKGTLLHGIRQFNENVLKSISSDGIVFEGFFGDKATTVTIGEACFFEVDKEQSMYDYYMSYNHDVTGEEIGEVPLYKHNSETKNLEVLRREAGYLPEEDKYKRGKSSNSVAFIINPTTDIQPLLEQKKKLLRFARGYSIPIGMPSNCISGILVSREVAQDQEKLAVIKQYFPDKYITTPDGELIYEPQRVETKKEETIGISIADAMRDFQIEQNDAFGQEIDGYFRNNPDIDVDTLSEYINELVDKVYKEFEDTTQTEDVNSRIERFNKRISTIRKNANFQRLAMSNDKGKELYGKIASLTETDIEEPGATDAKLGQEHQNETYLKRRDLEIRLKGLGYRMSSYDSNVSLEQALIAEKLLQQISIKHPSFLKLELGEMNGEELAFAQNELSRLGFNSQVPNQYEGTTFAQRIPLVMKKRSRDEITMCSQGINLGKQEINGVTQEARGIITQDTVKTNDGVAK